MGNLEHEGRYVFINTKLIPPRLPATLLQRPRLLNELQKGLERKLTIISAGAGTGKTILLASYVNSLDFPFVWYNLDPGARDPMVFLSYLIKGIQGQLEGFGSKALSQIKEAGKRGLNRELVLATLINEILKRLHKALLIILEDYHHVEDSKEIREILDYLLTYLPPNIHIFLTSRRKPNIDLVKLRAQKEVMELTAQELRFSDQETQFLFTVIYQIPLSSQDLKLLEQYTEGWIMGLQWIAEALRYKKPKEISSFLDRFKGSKGYIFRYLNEEVFQELPSEIQLFLKQSSILERFDTRICSYIMEEQDIPGITQSLLKKHFFLLEVDKEGEYYRYHPLFRDYLIAKLEKDEGQDFIKNLYRKAALYWDEKGEREEAIRHYLLSGDFETTADRIGEDVDELMATAGIETVQYWLKQIPEEIVALKAKLLYARGRIFYLKGNAEEALSYFSQAKERAMVEGNSNVIGLSLLYLMLIYIYSGSFEMIESLVNEGSKYLGRDSPYMTQISTIRACTLLYLNRLKEAGIEWEKLGSNHLIQSSEGSRFNCISFMGRYYYFPLGRFEEAISVIEEEIGYLRHNDPMGMFSYFLGYLAMVKHEMGHFDESNKLLGEAVKEMRKRGDSLFLYIVYSTIAINNFYMKDMDKAHTALREAEETLSEMKGGELWRLHRFLSVCALLAFTQGDKEGFYNNARQALKLTEERNEYWERYQVVCWLAPYYALLGDSDYAVELLKEIVEKTKKIGAIYGEARSHLLLSSITLDQKEVKLAKKHLKEVLTLCCKHKYEFLLLHKERSHAIKLLIVALRENIELQFVTQLLCRFGEEPVEAILPLLKDDSPEIRSIAAKMLSEIGYRDAEREIIHLLKDPNPNVRKIASEALTKIASLPPKPLKVLTLGRFQLFQGEREVEENSWRRKKAKSIFKYLLFKPDRSIKTEDLLDIFWPDKEPKQALDNLYHASSCLRIALEPSLPPKKESSYLKVREGVYQLILPEDSYVDAFAFEGLVSSASEAQKKGEIYQAIFAYQSALKLYQGNLFEKDIIEDWVIPLQEKYSDMYIKSLRYLSKHFFNRFEYDLCIDTLQRLLNWDSYDEEAHMLLIKCHMAMGDRVKAIKAYQRCCKLLREGLGVSPRQEITDLYLAITSKNRTARNTINPLSHGGCYIF